MVSCPPAAGLQSVRETNEVLRVIHGGSVPSVAATARRPTESMAAGLPLCSGLGRPFVTSVFGSGALVDRAKYRGDARGHLRIVYDRFQVGFFGHRSSNRRIQAHGV